MTQTKRTTPQRRKITATPLSKWKDLSGKTFPLDLPNGFTIIVRPLDLLDMAVTGYLPLHLVGQLIDTGEKLQDPAQLATVDQANLAKLNDMLRKVALRAVVEPRLTERDEEGALCVDELGILNMLTIFNATMDTAAAKTLRPFRGK